MTFVLFTPLAILLTFAAAERAGWLEGLVAFALASAMGHYLPGMLRAYGDQALFRRFRVRLIFAPLFFITITTWSAYLNLNFLFLLVALWGSWHWMMQVFGFARIYDAKGEPGARFSARLDQMLCLLWFGMCAFVLNQALPIYVDRFYQSGGPRLPAGAFAWFSRVWFVVTVALTLFYVIHTLRAARNGRPPNPLKLVFIAVTFVYLRYTASLIDQPVVGYAMFQIWHDIQYLAIVWLFNLNRARTSFEAGPFIRFLFRPRAILVAAYVCLCLAFGSLTHAWRLFENATMARVAFAFVIAMALLHYYLDGFIWKIREKETRQALGVRAGEELGPVMPWPAWIRHAALWLLLVIPGALFFVMESRGSATKPQPLQVYERLVETFPRSSHAHYQFARELQDVGRLREAKAEFERTLALSPGSHPSIFHLGVLLVDQGNLAEARPYLERALKIDPRSAQTHNNLGIVLDELGDFEGAKIHLERALALDPEYALAHNNLGEVLVKQGKPADAKTRFEQALRLMPDFPRAKKNLENLSSGAAQ